MKRNAKTIIAGMIALAISHTAMADDIKVAVVGAMSGPIAQWGDMEFNGARQAIKDINAKGELRAINWLAWNMTTPATRNKPLRSPTKSLTTALNMLLVICVPPSTQPASDIYEDEGILMISPERPTELTQRGYQYIMRTAGLDSSQGQRRQNTFLRR